MNRSKPDGPKPDVKRRTGGRSAVVRESVLGATLKILVERGYNELSYGEVASEAGVAESTVYRRWPTKPALAGAALAELTADTLGYPDTGSFEGDIRALFSAIMNMLRSPEIQRLIRAAAALENTGPEAASANDSFWAARREGDRRMVERAIERGEVAPGTDSEEVMELLVGPAYLRILITWQPLDERFEEESVRRTLRAYSLPPGGS